MCSLSTTNIKFLLLFAFIIFIVLWVQSTDITVPYRRYLYGYQHSQRKNIFSTKTSRCYFHEFGCVVIYFFFINVAMTTTKYGKNGIQVLEVCGCDSTVVVGV